jgi:hypothetical protein
LASGYHLLRFSGIKKKISNYETGLFGLIFLGILSLIVNFFVPLSKNINTIICLIIIISFFFQNRSDFRNLKKIIISSSKVTFVAFVFISFSKNFNPDSFLYHLPYTNLINDYKILPGSTLLHFRFGHTSIMQYVNAVFNNQILGINGITIPISLIFSFFFIFLLEEILKILKIKSSLDLYNFYIILAFIFLCLRMNRYSDYGNDHPSTIFFIYFISIFIKNFNHFDLDVKKYLSIFASFIFTLKVFYFIPLILCAYLWLSKVNLKIFNVANNISVFLLVFWFLKNILVSGCVIYPVSFTCINNLPWYDLSKNYFINANQISLESEAWAKNWNTHRKKETNLNKDINKNNSQKKYIKNFVWLQEWSNNHGKQIIKKIAPFLILVLILFLISRKEIKISKFKNIKLFIFLFSINLFGLTLWFLKFPIMRYGLAYIFIQIFLISFIFFRNKYLTNIKFILIFCLLILTSKNLLRIYNNFDYKPYPEIKNKSEYFKTKKNDLNIFYTKKGTCGYNKSPCTNYRRNIKNIDIKNYLSYKYISLKD